jgi:outer membrane porin, OprD family
MIRWCSIQSSSIRMRVIAGSLGYCIAPLVIAGDVGLTLESTSIRLNADNVDIRESATRHATVGAIRPRLRIGPFDDGDQVTMEVEPFVGVRLDGDGDSGNRVLLDDEGRATNQVAWAYLGRACLAWQAGSAWSLRAGLFDGVSAVLEPDLTRALPSSFRGVALEAGLGAATTLLAARFDGVVPRGRRDVEPLRAANSGIPIGAYSVLGARAQPDPSTSVLIYGALAEGAWRALHVAASRDFSPRLTARLSAYIYRPDSAVWRSHMNGRALSGYLRIGTSAQSVRVGLQRIFGRGYFDWVAESDGNDLVNAYAGDYNAPHETSIQFRLAQAGSRFCDVCPDLLAWATRSYGADASSAGSPPPASADLQDLYVIGETPRRGRNGEYGVRVSRSWTGVQGSRSMRASLVWIRYWRDGTYPGPSYDRLQFVFDATY